MKLKFTNFLRFNLHKFYLKIDILVNRNKQ